MTNVFEEGFANLRDTDLTREEGEFIWEYASEKLDGKTLWIGSEEIGPAQLLFQLDRHYIAYIPGPKITDQTGPTRPNYEIHRLPLNQLRRQTVCFVCIDIRCEYRDTIDRLNLGSRCGPCYLSVFGINDLAYPRATLACTRLLGRWEESVGRIALWNLRDRRRR